ncbi:pentapeptide repeat-containing protein [Neisseria sp. P0001.S009]|jgi:hypothetical protein|uniref:pentapeptide repeat-containing protein n=1 Tax=unclassified Neisseria TaxID=2623750 RepID=UPI003610D1F4
MKKNNMKIDREALLSILHNHQLWIKTDGQSGEQADLSGAVLTGMNLIRADLRRANLRGVNLRGADLRGSDLFGADLSGADLTGADLTHANLTIANLSRTDLTSAKLDKANLIKTNLRGADLTAASFDGAHLDGIDLTQLLGNSVISTDNLQRKLQSSEKIIQDLQIKLNQAQSNNTLTKNNDEITKLSARLEQEKLEKEKIKEELNSKIEELQKGLSNRIKDAQKSLSGALKNTDSQIQNNENTARWFKWLGIILFGLAIILLLVFSGFVLCNSKFFIEKNLNILFYTFPIITLMVIGTTCLRHQKNLLAEVRHFSNMKHQIELYSGLLEASQHAAVSFNNPEKANEYVQETFTQIRNRLLNSQYLPDHSSADNQSNNDFGSDKVIDLLSKIADLSGKKSI